MLEDKPECKYTVEGTGEVLYKLRFTNDWRILDSRHEVVDGGDETSHVLGGIIIGN